MRSTKQLFMDLARHGLISYHNVPVLVDSNDWCKCEGYFQDVTLETLWEMWKVDTRNVIMAIDKISGTKSRRYL